MRRERTLSIAADSRGPSRRRPGKPRVSQVDLALGRRLREARALAGVSQRTLGEAIGVSAQAVQKYESGEKRLSAVRLAAAVKFLGVPMSFLFRDDAAAETALREAGLSPEEIELVLCFRVIASPELRARLLRLAREASEHGHSGR